MSAGHQASGGRNSRTYEILEHTADLRIRVRAQDLKTLFARSAVAMFSIIAEKKKNAAARVRPVRVRLEAETLEELFICWLNELLSLSYSRKLVFADFRIGKISEHALEARVAAFSSRDFTIIKEIKAATYHQLKILRTPGGWKTEVIFDV